MRQGQYKITKEQQLKELTERMPPIVNVAVVVVRNGEYLIGRRNRKLRASGFRGGWLFPGGRMKFTEIPQETALRIIKVETPGLKAHVRKFITVMSDKGYDYRANGVTIYYLCDYVSGTPRGNEQLDKFAWVTRDTVSKLKNVYEVELRIFHEIDLVLRTLHSNEDEFLVEVDKRNREIGSILKRDAHSTNKRYHRAAHIMVFSSKGEVVLQQRGLGVIRYPGWWDMTGGHQVFGQTIDQCARAELAEELGVHTDLQLRQVRLGVVPTDLGEFSYLYFGISDGPYGFDRNEVEAIQSFDCEKLLRGDYDKKYTVLPHVKEYTRELRDVWEPLVKFEARSTKSETNSKI